MRIVSLTYINSSEFDQPMDWVQRLYAFTGVLEELGKQHTVFSIEQINYTGEQEHNKVHYYFRSYGKGVNRFPFRLHRLVRELKPDIVLVRGLHFPLQVMQLRSKLGSEVKIICEHHADKPSGGIKRLLNRLAEKSITAYHFTSKGHAAEWLQSGNIKEKGKCREIPPGSTYFNGYDKAESRHKLGWEEDLHFIWAGRLDANKDPVTVLKAFARFLSTHPSARLHMIYQEDELLPIVKKMIADEASLEKAVLLEGKIPHEEMELWYSAADFYISASHYEGGSIALIEAMACGCIPIVTSITASLMAIQNGQYGFHFEPGNANALYEELQGLSFISINEYSKRVKDHFQQELSFKAIARKFKTTP
jgi:glycosyltransferase involved in cell wall biosynthesis